MPPSPNFSCQPGEIVLLMSPEIYICLDNNTTTELEGKVNINAEGTCSQLAGRQKAAFILMSSLPTGFQPSSFDKLKFYQNPKSNLIRFGGTDID